MNPPTVEVSFEETGKMLGITTSGFGAYTSVVRADASVYGDGQSGIFTADGEMVAWKGSGQGKLLPAAL